MQSSSHTHHTMSVQTVTFLEVSAAHPSAAYYKHNRYPETCTREHLLIARRTAKQLSDNEHLKSSFLSVLHFPCLIYGCEVILIINLSPFLSMGKCFHPHAAHLRAASLNILLLDFPVWFPRVLQFLFWDTVCFESWLKTRRSPNLQG